MTDKSVYKGIESVRLDSGSTSAEIVVGHGGKLVSLLDKATGYEYIAQGEKEEYVAMPYDSDFLESDVCGFDDMFPAVDRGPYPGAPWDGAQIPDHGELWSIKWEHEICGEKLHMWTSGVRFPYHFDKTVSFAENGNLRMEYKVTNMSDCPMYGIWAAHCLINLAPGAVIELPPSVERIINMMDYNGRLGRQGKEHPWPVTTDKYGQEYHLDTILSGDAGVCEKFYAAAPLTEGWARVKGLPDGNVFEIQFPADKVPYMGVWITEGGLLGQYNGALEAATGAYDDLYLAKKWNACPRIDPRDTYEFWLELRTGVHQ